MTSNLAAHRRDGASVVNHQQLAAVGWVVERYLGENPLTPAKWDDAPYWNVDDSDDVRRQFLAVGNAINFRFWEQVGGVVVASTGVVDGERLRGPMYARRSLRRAVARGDLALKAHDLSRIDESGFVQAFSDDDGRLSAAARAGRAHRESAGPRLMSLFPVNRVQGA